VETKRRTRASMLAFLVRGLRTLGADIAAFVQPTAGAPRVLQPIARGGDARCAHAPSALATQLEVAQVHLAESCEILRL
jgi:hypothetical protein